MGSVEGWKYNRVRSKLLGQVQVNFQLRAKMKCRQSCTSISPSQSLQVGGGGFRNCTNSELIFKFMLWQEVKNVFSKQSIPTGCTTEKQWLDSRQVQEIFIFPKPSRSALQVTQPSIRRVPWAFCSGEKQAIAE
jgi:hypothetical protein